MSRKGRSVRGTRNGATGPTSEIIQAAGAVVWQVDPVTGPEVMLIHRPKYDDWSLPKGKLEPGEHPLACAVREVEEETGHRVRLDRPLPTQRYLSGGKPKEVTYWSAQADPRPTPRPADHEVDRIEMIPAAEAIARLTHQHDVDLVTALLRGPLETRSVVVLRHAQARDRGRWSGDDSDRPLARDGRATAERLVPVLQALGTTTIVSSPAVRCTATVEPLAEVLGVAIDVNDALSEDGYDTDGGAGLRACAKAAFDTDVTVLCSHRPVLPDLLSAVDGSNALDPGQKLAPGQFVVVNHVDGAVVAAQQYHM